MNERLATLQAGLRLLFVTFALHASAASAAEVPAIGAPWAVPEAPQTPLRPLPAGAPLRGDGPLSLAELSDYALRNNPSTRVAWAGALADGAGVAAASALLQPNVTLTTPLTLDHGAASEAAASGVTHSVSPTLGLTWVLFDFGARASGVEAARWQAVASQLAYNRELQNVVS